ncbi:MAG: hypothetical protein WD738_09475 [Pirellulales bacterium]
MSGTNQRTWQQYRVGHLWVTVQLDPAADRRSLEGQRELATIARRLITLMDGHGVPTTWAVSDPAHSAATALILRSAVDHELAILGDTYWVGPTAGRTRFARELARRVSQARTAGLKVTTLVPRVAAIDRHIDLIVKQQISAICAASGLQACRSPLLPRALHYGVWELPVTAALPVQSSWLFQGGWSTWRRIRRAAREPGAFHLLIDVPTITQEGCGAEKTIGWLMRRVAELRDRGLLHIETLGRASTRLASVPARSPQHSILRRAA